MPHKKETTVKFANGMENRDDSQIEEESNNFMAISLRESKSIKPLEPIEICNDSNLERKKE